jgi:hypothetical protein
MHSRRVDITNQVAYMHFVSFILYKILDLWSETYLDFFF